MKRGSSQPIDTARQSQVAFSPERLFRFFLGADLINNHNGDPKSAFSELVEMFRERLIPRMA